MRDMMGKNKQGNCHNAFLPSMRPHLQKTHLTAFYIVLISNKEIFVCKTYFITGNNFRFNHFSFFKLFLLYGVEENIRT